MFEKKWIYSLNSNGCLAVLVEKEEDYERLKGVFNDARSGKYTEIPVSKALKLIEQAKVNVEQEDAVQQEKPKRKRRTKAEIEADKKLEEDSKKERSEEA